MWERHLQRRQREEEELQQRTELRGRNSSHSEGRRRRARASSLERSESQGRSCSPSCSGGEGSKRRRSSRERSGSSSSGSSDEEGMAADGRKRQRGQSPSGGVKSWRSAGRGGQDKEEVAVSSQGVAAYEGSEDVSDDAIAAMIASKRSRWAKRVRVIVAVPTWGRPCMHVHAACSLGSIALFPGMVVACATGVAICPSLLAEPALCNPALNCCPNACLLFTEGEAAAARAPRCQAHTFRPVRWQAGSLKMRTPSLCGGSSWGPTPQTGCSASGSNRRRRSKSCAPWRLRCSGAASGGKSCGTRSSGGEEAAARAAAAAVAAVTTMLTVTVMCMHGGGIHARRSGRKRRRSGKRRRRRPSGGTEVYVLQCCASLCMQLWLAKTPLIHVLEGSESQQVVHLTESLQQRRCGSETGGGRAASTTAFRQALWLAARRPNTVFSSIRAIVRGRQDRQGRRPSHDPRESAFQPQIASWLASQAGPGGCASDCLLF